MTREEFKKAYYSTTDKELAEKLGTHAQTVRNKAKRLGLKPKGSGYIYPDQSKEKIVIEG